MWPFASPDQPEISTLHAVVHHLNLLSGASETLVSSAQMLLLQSNLRGLNLMDFRESAWPNLVLPSPTTTDALKRKYNLPPGMPLPKDKAARIFIEVRDFAIEMNKTERVLRIERWALSSVVSIFPAWLVGTAPLSEEVLEIVKRWEKLLEREEELQWWLDGAATLGRRVEVIVRGGNVPIERSGDHDRLQGGSRQRMGSQQLESRESWASGVGRGDYGG